MRIVKTNTKDGYEFSGLFSEAVNSQKIIIHVHGMGGSIVFNEFYEQMHLTYKHNGISFLAGENRGSGEITGFSHKTTDGVCGNAFEIFEDCVFDIQAWVDFAKSLGYQEIWSQAHSLGPAKVAYYLNQTKNNGIKGAIFISPGDILGLVKDMEGKADFGLMYPEALELVKKGKPYQLLSHKLWGEYLLSAKTFLNFFESDAKTAIFNFYDNAKWDIVNGLELPVLAITGTKDDAIVPVMDAYKAMEKLKHELKKSPKVKTIVYGGANHSFNGFGERIVDDVLDFIKL